MENRDIAASARPEVILQMVLLVGVVAVLEWIGARTEIALFTLLILGFTLNTWNILASLMISNVHLGEIREMLHGEIERSRGQGRRDRG